MAASLLVLFLAPPLGAVPPQYVVLDLGVLPGGVESSATHINNFGQVTGYSNNTVGGPSHAFLYSGGAMQDLGTLGGSSSFGLGINDAGQIGGWSFIADGAAHAFLYTGGNMNDLGLLTVSPFTRASQGFAINNSGQVTGYSDYHASTGENGKNAFLYSGGMMTDLGSLTSPMNSSFSGESYGAAINDAGQVTGRSITAFGVEHAFLSSGGSMSDVGAFGGALTQTYTSHGTGINNAGQVTGWSDTANGGTNGNPGGTYFRHAFLYSGGSLSDLGTLPGETFSLGNAIDQVGRVVGSSGSFVSTERAFLYSGGTMYALNDLATNLASTGLFLTRANGINNNGWIVGLASINGVQHAFLAMTPVVSVTSRKTHGGAGTFDLPLPLIGPTAVESRTSGAGGNHTIIFSFPDTLNSVGGVAITRGSGSVGSGGIGSDAHEYVVNLTGVANAQNITVMLTDVTDSQGRTSTGVSATMGVLVGDANGDRIVNSGDAQVTKNRSGQSVSATNFRTDFNLDGSINSADAIIVRAHSGNFLP